MIISARLPKVWQTPDKLPKSAVAWAGPVGLVCAGLQTAGLIGVGRALYLSNKFQKELVAEAGLNKVGEYTLGEFEKGVAFLNSKSDAILKKHFRFDGSKVKDAIARIGNDARAKMASGDPEQVREGQKQLKDTMEVLKNRISQKENVQQVVPSDRNDQHCFLRYHIRSPAICASGFWYVGCGFGYFDRQDLL